MKKNDDETFQLEQAVATLKAGNLVAFPTETVYGLGADANNPTAVGKVFKAKNRPATHPLIVHIADISQLNKWVSHIPKHAETLGKHFWPGPLTIILPKKDCVNAVISGGLPTIAVRVPKHPLTLKLLRKFDSGLVGPSANTHCRISPTSAAHVRKDLGAKVDFILDGGDCKVGIESTIIGFDENDTPFIARQGSITATEISNVLGIEVAKKTNTSKNINVPGNMQLHYAPKKPLLLLNAKELATTLYSLSSASNVSFEENHLLSNFNFKNISVISFQPAIQNLKVHSWQQMPLEQTQYATKLYAALHNADQPDTDIILVENPPNSEGWEAINDRLTKSSHNVII